MSKSVYWFKHDLNAHQDTKCKAMMSVYGAEGYGWYWIMIELMRQEDGCKISISRKFDIPSLASSLPNCNDKKCKEFIDDCVNEFELFKSDGTHIWSERAMKGYKEHQRKSKNGQKAAYKKHGKDENGIPLDQKAPFDEEEINADKPKEKKEEDPAKIKGIQVLKDDELFNMFVEDLKKHDDFKEISAKYISSERDKCLDWIAAKGTTKKDYKAFFRNWLRNNKDEAPKEETEQFVSKMKKGMII